LRLVLFAHVESYWRGWTGLRLWSRD
jgi:hypothetical protein